VRNDLEVHVAELLSEMHQHTDVEAFYKELAQVGGARGGRHVWLHHPNRQHVLGCRCAAGLAGRSAPRQCRCRWQTFRSSSLAWQPIHACRLTGPCRRCCPLHYPRPQVFASLPEWLVSAMKQADMSEGLLGELQQLIEHALGAPDFVREVDIKVGQAMRALGA
jgi:hypothetical protein